MTRRTLLPALILAAALCCGNPARADDLLLPKGTVLPVALIHEINSATAKVGDTIKAVYTGEEDAGFPEGTVFVAEVKQATAKSEKAPGSVTLVFKLAVLPGNKGVPIQGKAVDATPSSGQKNRKNETGKGAAIGTAAGLIISRNKMSGAIIGGATGAFVGSKTGSKPRDVIFKKGTAFGVELTAAARVPQQAAAKPRAAAAGKGEGR